MDHQTNIPKGDERMDTPTNHPEGNIIFSYTSEQACEDGILFNVEKSNFLRNKLVSFITTSLLIELDIMKYDAKVHADVINTSMALDLIEQAQTIVNRVIANTLSTDRFYSGDVRKQSAERIKVFIVENETGKFTLMLPSDY